jgi:class 3 adenylate cyclase
VIFHATSIAGVAQTPAIAQPWTFSPTDADVLDRRALCQTEARPRPLCRFLHCAKLTTLSVLEERVEAERRQVTVLFTDMVGFMAFSEKSGEEAAFGLIRNLTKPMDDAQNSATGRRLVNCG